MSKITAMAKVASVVTRKRFFRATLVASAAIALSNCASHGQIQPDPQPHDETLSSLVKSAKDIQKTWDDLGSVERAQKPAYINYSQAADFPNGQVPKGLDQQLSVSWAGPIEPLIVSMAKQANYDFEILGKRPAAPVLVYVSEERATVSEILKDAGVQAGQKAGVVVRPELHRIQLVYVP